MTPEQKICAHQVARALRTIADLIPRVSVETLTEMLPGISAGDANSEQFRRRIEALHNAKADRIDGGAMR